MGDEKSRNKCPFCEEHNDDLFVKSVLIEEFICDGCSQELCIFCLGEERPNDKLIDKVEALTKKDWQECRIMLLEEKLGYWAIIARGENQEFINSTRMTLKWNDTKIEEYVQNQVITLTKILEKAKK